MIKYIKNWAILFTVLGFLFWNPTTRAIILWILPLGSGMDDFVFAGALILALALWLLYKVSSIKITFSKKEHGDGTKK